MQQLSVVRQRRRERRQRMEKPPPGVKVGRHGRLTVIRGGIPLRRDEVLAAVGRKV